MENLNIIEVEYDKAYKIVKENLYSCKTVSKEISDTKYHHQTDIKQLPSILKYGILSKDEFNRVYNMKLTEKESIIFCDECHTNGLTRVSVSSMDVDFSQIYRDEFYWDSSDFAQADIIVSKDIKAFRYTINFFNEFLVEKGIPVDKFNCIDLKILKAYSDEIYEKIKNTKENRIKKMVCYYNYLYEIALCLINGNLDIPIREVSEEKITLDPQKIIKLPSIKLR